jgi:uncharacterized protein
MPTIRELVSTLRAREGVEAVVLLGRDGLRIDGNATDGLDTDLLAAHVPAIVQAADEFALAAGRAPLATAILELGPALAVLSLLGGDTLLLVLLRADAAVAPLLYELRRHRADLAALV